MYVVLMTLVLGVSGSLRRASWNRLLIENAAALAPDGMAVRLTDLLRRLPLFDEDLEAETGGGPESVELLRREVRAADALLIASPEYNWSVPGVLKNALDWLSRPSGDVLSGKPVAVIGATTGRWGTRLAQGALRQVLTATESIVMPSPALFVSDAGSRFDGTGRLSDPATRNALEAVLSALQQWIGRVSEND